MPDTESIRGTSNINMLHWINRLGDNGRLAIFLDFYKALPLFVTILVTSCSGERAFSKLTIVKSKLRSIMVQNFF